MSDHAELAPSSWVRQWSARIPAGSALDLACGRGRHARLLLERGLRVVAVDREPQQLSGIRFVHADLENGSPWPLAGESFTGIVVTNYLHRPLLPLLQEALAPGGLLIYETFMQGNERFGRPSRPEHLLRSGELLEVFSTLALLGFEEGFTGSPKPSMIQRLCAAKLVKG